MKTNKNKNITNLNIRDFESPQLGYYIKTYQRDSALRHSPSTKKSNNSRCNVIYSAFGNVDITTLNYDTVSEFIAELHQSSSNKTVNEYLTVLRAIFNIAVSNGVVDRCPLQDVENLQTLDSEINPFTLAEIKLMNNAQVSEHNEKALVLFTVLTGLRISEVLPLTWDDVDFKNGTINVKRALVDGILKVPKTKGSAREVSLCEIAIKILEEQKRRTFALPPQTVNLLREDNKTMTAIACPFIFVQTKSQKAFLNVKQFQKNFFTPFLKSLGIKHRGPSHLRHTYASQSLSSGISKEWIAKQLGHTSTAMVSKHYAKWIQSDMPDYCKTCDDHFKGVFFKEEDEDE